MLLLPQFPVACLLSHLFVHNYYTMKLFSQELKEILDRHKWQQAEYSFQGQQDDGGHICQINVRDAGITGIVSQPCPNQRAAKASAASLALSQLVQKGLAHGPTANGAYH